MKKFITIALAVAVLFSFAACQQAYKVPTGFSVSATKTSYIVGDALDLSTVTGTVEYSDGSTKTVAGGELATTTTTISSGETSVTFTYGDFSAKLPIKVYSVSDIDTLTVTLPETLKKGATTAEVKGVATLPDGTTADVTVELTFTAIAGNSGEKEDVSVSAATIGGTSVADKIKGQTDEWEITVANASEMGTVTSLIIEQVNTTSTDGEDWVGDTVTFKVYASDGTNRVELTSGYTWKDGKAPSSTYVLKGEANASSETYTAIYDEIPTISSNAFKYETTAAEDWVSVVTITPKENAKVPAGGLTVTNIPTYYDVTGVSAKSGKAETFALTEANAVIKNPTVPAYGTEAGQATTYTMDIVVKYGKAEAWTPVSVAAVEIAH